MINSAIRIDQSMKWPRPETIIALKQVLVIAILVATVWLLSAVHLASIARPLFVATALALAIYYIGRSPWQYLNLVFWFWTISPFMRRICDYYSQPEALNIVLITPNILSVLMLPSLLTSKTLLKRREAAAGLLLLGPSLYGLCVSFVAGDIFPAAVAAIDWIVPLIYYWYIIENAETIDKFKPYFSVYVSLGLALVAYYGLYQDLSPPPWDVKYWNVLKGADDLFKTFPVFSTMNGVGICSTWLVMLIILSLGFNGLFTAIFVLPVALLTLMMTEVRSSTAALLLGLLLTMIFGRGRLVTSLLGIFAATLITVGLFASLDSDIASKLTSRFSTVGDLQHDYSAQARQDLLYNQAPNMIEKSPFGIGIGSFGKGARADPGSAEAGKKVDAFDNGLLASFVVFGWVVGFIYFFGLFAIVAQGCLAAWRSGSQLAMILAINAVAGLATSFFTINNGIQGLILWFNVAYAVALDIHVRHLKTKRIAEAHAEDAWLIRDHSQFLVGTKST